jgi:hypothetical protein
MDAKKRSLSETEQSNQKKQKLQDFVGSPKTKQRGIKVIPPKDPKDVEEPLAASTSTENKETKEIKGSIKLTLKKEDEGEARTDPSKPKTIPPLVKKLHPPASVNTESVDMVEEATKIPYSQIVKPASPKKSNAKESKSPESKTKLKLDSKDVEKDNKETKQQTSVEKIISQMEFSSDKDRILKLIEEAKKKSSDSIVLNDARLLNMKHPNYNLYLGLNELIKGMLFIQGRRQEQPILIEQ